MRFLKLFTIITLMFVLVPVALAQPEIMVKQSRLPWDVWHATYADWDEEKFLDKIWELNPELKDIPKYGTRKLVFNHIPDGFKLRVPPQTGTTVVGTKNGSADPDKSQKDLRDSVDSLTTQLRALNDRFPALAVSKKEKANSPSSRIVLWLSVFLTLSLLALGVLTYLWRRTARALEDHVAVATVMDREVAGLRQQNKGMESEIKTLQSTNAHLSQQNNLFNSYINRDYLEVEILPSIGTNMNGGNKVYFQWYNSQKQEVAFVVKGQTARVHKNHILDNLKQALGQGRYTDVEAMLIRPNVVRPGSHNGVGNGTGAFQTVP